MTSNARVVIDVIECVDILDRIALPYWQFWNQRDRAIAKIYAWSLTEIIKHGELDDLFNLYTDLQKISSDPITLRLVYELDKILN